MTWICDKPDYETQCTDLKTIGRLDCHAGSPWIADGVRKHLSHCKALDQVLHGPVDLGEPTSPARLIEAERDCHYTLRHPAPNQTFTEDIVVHHLTVDRTLQQAPAQRSKIWQIE